MKVVISDKIKKDLFAALFQTLKNCSAVVSAKFMSDKLHIQGIDKSHVCLFDVNIQKDWFSLYDIDDETPMCFDTNIFQILMSTKSEGHEIVIHTNDSDYINIDLVSLEHSKGEFNKYFKIPLVDNDHQELNVPSVDYDADFAISSKKISEIVSQMMVFGSDIIIKCSEYKIDLVTNGVTGEMLVTIPIDDLTEYSIIEDENVNLTYSLNYINKMCLTNKLSSEVNFSISKEYPMKISYDLGNDSSLVFYIAPKVTD
jgi:proliferating cell nuclear antigen PCNA